LTDKQELEERISELSLKIRNREYSTKSEKIELLDEIAAARSNLRALR
jgi:hypothetical protein